MHQSDPSTPQICDDIMSSRGGKFGTIVGGSCSRADIQSIMSYGQSVMCDSYATMEGPAKQTAELRALAEKFWKWALTLLVDGKILPPPFEVKEGLEGALAGMNDIRGGKVSGKKIVSRLG